MLKSEPIEFFLRAIPESFLYLLGIYVFSKVRIHKRKFIKASVMIALVMYCIRLLPINYGVHTILSILFIIFLSIFYNKIDSIQAIKSTIIMFLIQFLSEGINMLILMSIFNKNLEGLFNNVMYKTLLGLPSLIITLIILYSFYKKKDAIKNG